MEHGTLLCTTLGVPLQEVEIDFEQGERNGAPKAHNAPKGAKHKEEEAMRKLIGAGVVLAICVGIWFFWFRGGGVVPVVEIADGSEAESEGAGDDVTVPSTMRLPDGWIINVVIPPVAEESGVVEKVMPDPKGKKLTWMQRTLPNGRVSSGWVVLTEDCYPTNEKGETFCWKGLRRLLTEAPPTPRMVAAKKPNPCGATKPPASRTSSCGVVAPPAATTNGSAVSVTGGVR